MLNNYPKARQSVALAIFVANVSDAAQSTANGPNNPRQSIEKDDTE